MNNRQWWDTDFYLEQWASFHPTLSHTLVLRNKITNVSSVPLNMWTRQLPIIFARYLPRLSYFKNGQKTIYTPGSQQYNFSPDANWAAVIAADKEAGIGMVAPLASLWERFLPLLPIKNFG